MKISVIIPCHNAAEYVGQTMGSLLEQTRPPDEIVLIVDRSTDQSIEVARLFGEHVRVYQVDFGHASKTRNFGAEKCTGDALMFLDADDVLGPEALEGLEAALRKEPAGVALVPWFRLEESRGQWIERPASVPLWKQGEDLLRNWLTGRYYPPCCLLWSREALERVGGWSEELSANQDGDLAMRALVDEVVLVQADCGHAYYRRIADNRSVSGQRFTPQGVSSRLRVAQKMAVWLEERDRLSTYRYALTCAFEDILRDCREGGFADLADRCESLREQYGVHPYSLNGRQALRSAALHARVWRNRSQSVVQRVFRKQSRPALEKEVSFGLRTATAAAEGQFCQAAIPPVLDEPPAPAPTVSVIIPTYNRARLVCRAIKSVLNQTFGDFELLVVDDASTDETEEMVAAFEDPRIRYIRQPENRDVSAARNRGLREARGAFIAFLDSDDEWLPEKLELQVELLGRSPETVGLVYAGAVVRYDSGQEEASCPEYRGDVLKDILLVNITDKGSASVMIRRDVVRVVGFFDEKIPAMEDHDYWIRVARFYQFDYVDRPLVRYYELRRSDRRSLVRKSDILARRRLFNKHRSSLDSHGLTHRFLVISARRRLVRYRRPDRLGALSLSLRAVMSAPSAFDGYRSVFEVLYPGKTLKILLGKVRESKAKALLRS